MRGLAECGHQRGDNRQNQHVLGRHTVVAPVEHTIGEQPDQEARHQHRFVNLEFRLDEEVHGRDRRDHIDEPMQSVPALRSEPADGGISRGHAERDQSDQRHRSDQQIEPQHDLACDLEQVEVFVERVEREMQHCVTRRCNAEGAPRQDDTGIVEDALCRCDREREQEKTQRPVARLVDRLGDRTCTEVAGPGLPGDPQRRQDRGREGHDLHRRPASGPFAQEWHLLDLSRLRDTITARMVTPIQLPAADYRRQSHLGE